MTYADASGSRALLRLVGIDRRFGDLWAVRGADLEVSAGAVHAVIGENGAGKSTLLKIAAGILPWDAGEVWVAGARQDNYDAARAQALGVAMVQQHFALFRGLSALENMMLGAEPTRGWGGLDVGVARAKAATVLRSLGASFDLDARVETFDVGDKQRLEIARALYRDARTIILDEPTAVLTPGEAITLYATLRRLAHEGRGVVVVTHKLDEVEAYADAVIVMRRGQTLTTRPVVRGADLRRLASEVVGGQPLPELHAAPAPPERGAVRLSVRSLASGRALRGVSFEVREGEIVGVAGVLGNGQSELCLALGGLLAPDSGDIVAGSIAVVHEDRQAAGLVLDASVADNLVLGGLARFTRHGVVDDDAVDVAASERVVRFDIRPPATGAPVRALSGGNQQKIVLARALAGDPEVLVVAHPTRGVDVLASRAIHEQIVAAAGRGTAVVVVGSDLTELRVLCQRILVMVRGRVVATLAPTATDAALGAAMLGAEGAP